MESCCAKVQHGTEASSKVARARYRFRMHESGIRRDPSSGAAHGANQCGGQCVN